MPASKSPRPTSKAALHPRNRHSGRYDFARLIAACPPLGDYVILNPYGKPSIDFADPEAVKVFNRALLRLFYGIEHWDIPARRAIGPMDRQEHGALEPDRQRYPHH